MDDKVLINLLVEIAGLEEKLAAADHVLTHHATRKQDLRELQDEYEDDANTAEATDKDANVQLRVKETEIRATEESLARKKEQLGTVIDGRQHRAVTREIKDLAENLARLEDEAMAVLQALEGTAEDRKETQVDWVRQSGKGQSEISRMAGESQQAAGAQTTLLAERERLMSMLPEAHKRHAARLQKKGGQAIVHVESGACGGCFGALPAQVALDVEKGKAAVRCPSCARYIVHRPWR